MVGICPGNYVICGIGPGIILIPTMFNGNEKIAFWWIGYITSIVGAYMAGY
jgi:hypothetical protein